MLTETEVLRHFANMNHVVLATVEEDQPRLRPITLVYHGDCFYFATTSSDNKVSQLEENPKVELILQWQEPPNNGYIRLEGIAIKQTDSIINTQLYETYDFMKKLWAGPEDPNFTVYKIKPTQYDYLKPGEWSTHKLRIKI